jgi:hypothetical protein
MSCRYWSNSAGGREIVTEEATWPWEHEVDVVGLFEDYCGFPHCFFI